MTSALTAKSIPPGIEKGATYTKLPFTAVLIAYNNADVIERCLTSVVDLADEIIVVHDGPCGDVSLDIARKFTDKVFVWDRQRCSEAHRPAAYRMAKNDWILQLDSDEYLSEEARRCLPELLTADVDVYDFNWPTRHQGRVYHGTYKNVLFRKSRIYFIGVLHEYPKPVDASVRMRRVECELRHEPNYQNFSWRTFRSKWDSFARRHAEQMVGDFSRINTWNYAGQGWDYPNSARLKHPFLLGICGSLAFHVINGIGRAIKYRTLFHLRAELSYGLYYCLMFGYVIKLRSKTGQTSK